MNIPAEPGQRFTIRRRLTDGSFGDVIGVLVAIDDGHVELQDRHGVRHRIARATVIASRRVPDRPARRPRADG